MKSINKTLTAIIITAISFNFFGCSQSQQETSGHDEHQDEVAISEENAGVLESSIPKERSQNILTAYLEIKDALVKTDGEQASLAAGKLIEVLNKSNDELIEKIRFDAEHIEETKTPKHQRDHFNSLSDNVYKLIKQTQANDEVIYRQYCPMAFDNEGAFWLSAEKEVNNPYFGDRMLHCGSVKETLTTL